MISEDDNGERVLEISHEYGTTNDFGIEAVGTYQNTDAASVDQLKGKSTKVGGDVNIPTPIGSVGAGAEHVKGSDYEGTNYNLSWSPKLERVKMPTKPIIGSVKHEKTWTQKVPKITQEYDPDLW